MKKLILFTSSYPYGDRETYLETEIKYLSQKFNHIVIYPFHYKNNSEEFRRVPKGVEVKKPLMPIKKRAKIYIFFKNFFNSQSTKLMIIEFFNKKVYLSTFKILKWMRTLMHTVILRSSNAYNEIIKEKESVFYFWWGTNWAWLLCFNIKHNSNKYFVRLHGGEVFHDRNNNFIPLSEEIFKNADILLSISETLRSYLVKKYNIKKNKILISRLGVDFHVLNPPNNQKIISMVSISNLIELKRVKLIIDILSDIKKEVKWVHFGDGPLKEDLEKYSLKKLQKNIKFNFIGQKPNSYIINYFSNTPVDFVINLSKYEGLPFSLIEAMSFGIPCIATDAGATKEIVNDDNGILLKLNFDQDKLIKEIENVKSSKFQNKRKSALNTWKDFFNADKNYSTLWEILDF